MSRQQSEGAADSRSRVVLVTRKTRYEVLLAAHSTRAQASFFLASRKQKIEPIADQHEEFREALNEVQRAMPPDQRLVRVDRDDLDRFLFAPDDVVLVLGQDGLIPNVAKYLDGQLIAGINPAHEQFEGTLCRHRPADVHELIPWMDQSSHHRSRFRVEERVMASVTLEDGQSLLSLNEVFIGHQTHQSARYRVVQAGQVERQSSSGVIVSTGTGCGGWARSIVLQRGIDPEHMPEPAEPRLAWFVREPWPSVATSSELNFGYVLPEQSLTIISEMAEGGIIFADGIESDRIQFGDGKTAEVSVASRRLNLVVQ